MGQALAAFAVLAAAGAYALSNAAFLGRTVEAVRAWDARHVATRSSEGTARLFRDLLAKKLVRFDPVTARFAVEDCDFERRSAVDPALRDDQKIQGKLGTMRRLCDTETGYAIRQQTAAWNRLGLTLAVRDDRAAGTRCSDPAAPILAAVAPTGCHPAQWRAEAETGTGRPLRIEASDGSAPAPAVFGFAALRQHPGFGDWFALPASELDAGVHRLATALPPGPAARTVTAQVTGHIVEVLVDGAPVTAEVRAMCAGERRFVCDEASPAPGDDTPRVEEAAITVPGGERERALVLRASPLRAVPRELAGLERAKIVNRPEGGAAAPFQRRFQLDSIVLECRDRDRPEPVCFLDWEPLPGVIEASARGRGSFRLTAGGVEVAASDKGAAAAPAAYDLGLAHWIGATPGDHLSLAFGAERAARAGKTVDLPLTILPTHQSAAESALSALMRGQYPRVTDAALPSRHGAERRGAIVLIDAAEKSGAILAAATWPRLDGSKPLHEWDLAAYDLFRPARSPLAARAWAAMDQFISPGSTFKIVTALALLEASQNDPKIERIVRGVPEPELREALGVETCDDPQRQTTFDCLKVDGSTIRNFENEPLAHAEQDLPCSLPSEVEPIGKTIGLRQAISDSSNLYFAGVTALLPAGKSPADHVIARAANRLYPTSPPGEGAGGFSLVPHPDGAIRDARRVRAEPMVADFLEGGPDERKRRILASYGQTVQASPVAIASIMAGVATGRKTTPYLLANAPPRRGAPLLGEAMAAFRQDRLLNEIRCGMRSVVTRGTASDRKIDPSLIEGIYGKTGTAQVEGVAEDTVWFAGWLNGDPASRLPKRVAFACMVTHASGTGGGVCAPLMSDLLLSLRRRGEGFAAARVKRVRARAKLAKGKARP